MTNRQIRALFVGALLVLAAAEHAPYTHLRAFLFATQLFLFLLMTTDK